MSNNEERATKTLTVRLDGETYAAMMEVLDDIGLDFSGAVRMYARQMIREQGFPFKPGPTQRHDDAR